jgi:hypothetical protein
MANLAAKRKLPSDFLRVKVGNSPSPMSKNFQNLGSNKDTYLDFSERLDKKFKDMSSPLHIKLFN